MNIGDLRRRRGRPAAAKLPGNSPGAWACPASSPTSNRWKASPCSPGWSPCSRSCTRRTGRRRRERLRRCTGTEDRTAPSPRRSESLARPTRRWFLPSAASNVEPMQLAPPSDPPPDELVDAPPLPPPLPPPPLPLPLPVAPLLAPPLLPPPSPPVAPPVEPLLLQLGTTATASDPTTTALHPRMLQA